MCAECHTHKYDPITQEDYYRMFALFNTTADAGNYSLEPTVAVPAPPVSSVIDYLHGRLDAMRLELAAAEKQLPAEQQAWERKMAGQSNIWVTLNLTNAISTGGATFSNMPDQSILATGVNPTYDTYQIEAETTLTNIT